MSRKIAKSRKIAMSSLTDECFTRHLKEIGIPAPMETAEFVKLLYLLHHKNTIIIDGILIHVDDKGATIYET